jgi:hypothetical protein
MAVGGLAVGPAAVGGVVGASVARDGGALVAAGSPLHAASSASRMPAPMRAAICGFKALLHYSQANEDENPIYPLTVL